MTYLMSQFATSRCCYLTTGEPRGKANKKTTFLYCRNLGD